MDLELYEQAPVHEHLYPHARSLYSASFLVLRAPMRRLHWPLPNFGLAAEAVRGAARKHERGGFHGAGGPDLGQGVLVSRAAAWQPKRMETPAAAHLPRKSGNDQPMLAA